MLTRRNLLGSLVGAMMAWCWPKKREPQDKPTSPLDWVDCTSLDDVPRRLRDPFGGESQGFYTRRYVRTEWHRNSAGELIPIDVGMLALVYRPQQ